MKILVLHLSDSHIRSTKTIDMDRIDKLSSSLSHFKNFDECLIIFSGDIAYRGIENEYKIAGKFLGSLIDSIKKKFNFNKYIKVLVVPGNHDVQISNKERTRHDIINYYKEKEGNLDIFIEEEVQQSSCFWEFSKRNKCFSYENKVLDIRNLIYEDFKIQVNLINTAMFSILKDDKGIHYLPPQVIERLGMESNSNLTITVMHHGPEWFNQKDKESLDKALCKRTSILFLGHEHSAAGKDIITDENESMQVIAGGILGDENQPAKSQFNILVLDTEELFIERCIMNWDAAERFYRKEKKHKVTIPDKRKLSSKIEPCDCFLKFLENDDKNKLSVKFNEYFVFPRMVMVNTEKYSENEEICHMDTFTNELDEKRQIIIEGGENSGKTSLLKSLSLELLRKNKVVMLFRIDDISNKKTGKIIKDVFEDQYSSSESDYIRFTQMDKNNKVAIVDDVDKIKESVLANFIDILKENFGYVILSSKRKWDINLIKNAKDIIKSEEGSFIKYQIEGFYHDKRKELIKKICLLNPNSVEQDLNNFVNRIDSFIKNQAHLFRIDPDFIVQYMRYLVDGKDRIDTINNKDVFNTVFEHNILSKIINKSKTLRPDEVIIILEEIAYYIHFNRKYPITRDDFIGVSEIYNEEYGENINSKDLFDICLNSGIIKEIDKSWNIRFTNNNYLAYFVARRLNRKFNENSCNEDILYIINNISFGINGDILLFLSYITKNVKILISICESSNAYINEWEEFNIDKGNIKYMNSFNDKIKIKPPNKEDKEKAVKLQTISEKEMKKNEEEILETLDIYDYDDLDIDSYHYQIMTALKYTELVAKSLPNFTHLLNKVTKDAFIDNIYTAPNKIIYKVLSEIDKDFDNYTNEIVEYSEEMSESSDIEKINREDAELMIRSISLNLILSLYNQIANMVSDYNTIGHLNRKDIQGNSNYLIQNIMMEENIGNISGFINKAGELYDETKNYVVKRMIIRMIRKCLLYNTSIERGQEQHLRDKYFGTIQGKALLLDKQSK